MARPRFIAFVIVTYLACASPSLAQTTTSPLEGVWQVDSVGYVRPQPGATDERFAFRRAVANPIGLVFFVGRHYSMMFLTNSARPNISPDEEATASASQLRAMWGPLTANAGTFELTGDRIVTHSQVAKNAGVMASGAFNEFAFVIQGDRLTLTSTRDQNGPTPNGRTVEMRRVR